MSGKKLVEVRCKCNPKKKKGYLLGMVEVGAGYALMCKKCKKIKSGVISEQNT